MDGVTVWDQLGTQGWSRRAKVVVLSHDCEMVKPNDRAEYALVVELRSAVQTLPSTWGNIKAGRGFNAMYIPATPTIGEGFLDFGRVYRVDKATLQAAPRMGSMTDDSREALIYALASYLLHVDLGPPATPAPGPAPTPSP